MKLFTFQILILISGIVPLCTKAQDVPIGSWKDYLSYQSNLRVCQGGNQIYCTSQSGVFSYNLSDNSIERFNRVTGLSDVSATVAKYDSYNNTLLIGYSDGNLDVVQGNQVINMPDLLNATVQGSKIINDIYFVNNIAYVSCGQGILQIDLSQDIVLNTFNLSSTGNPINVHSITINNDTIFAATDKGLYKADVNNANLNDYANWTHITAPVLPPGKYNAITSLGNQVIAAFSAILTYQKGNADTLYVYSAGVWSHYSYVQGGAQVNSLESANGYLVIATSNEVKVINSSAVLTNDISYASYYISPEDAIIDDNMNIWIADYQHGLIRTTGDGTGISIYPPGPYSNDVTAIAIENNNIWITPGGYNQSDANDYISNIGVSTYQNSSWYRILGPDFNKGNIPILDINCIAIDPRDATHAFAGSWGNGLIEYMGNSIVQIYDTSNSTIQNQQAISNYLSIRVGGVAYDTLGNLWVTNALPYSKYLSVRKTDGTWKAFDFKGLIGENLEVVGLMVTKNNAKWMVVKRSSESGILVFQDNGTFEQPNAQNTILITAEAGNGALPDVNIYSMAQDLNGTVWVGTDQRVVAFYSPDNVLDGNHDWDAQPIYVNQGGYTQYLMQNQTTTAIAIDGANRKWIGTQSGGVFLMSADGTQQIYNFTTSNSPLLSNNINCITINPSNGEVFFGMDKGIVSFRSTATEGSSVFTNVYAFPNPVPHDYDGVIAIKGLVTNSDVKITTANGELVYHTVALGGQAIWNGNNFSGQRVQTGVYLVFCSSPDGSQSHVTKLLFLN